jgi:hypothetical protein
VETLFEQLQDVLTGEREISLEMRLVRRRGSGRAVQYRVPKLDARWMHATQASAAFRLALAVLGGPVVGLDGGVIREREVRIRLDRDCAKCGNRHRIGERMLYRVVATGGELVPEYSCVYDCRKTLGAGNGRV